jgi:hypothetical protein
LYTAKEGYFFWEVVVVVWKGMKLWLSQFGKWELLLAFAYVMRVECSAGELTNRNTAECVTQTKWKGGKPDSKYL